MPDIDDEFLTPGGMAAAHAAITTKYPWFLHIKPVRKFVTIKKAGLQPRSQGCRTNCVVKAALNVSSVDEMIFLRPIGTFDSTPRRGEKLFAMAMAKDALPATITVDWTYVGTWGLGQIIKNDSPSAATSDIFCEVVRRRGSIAIYQAIPPELLRVRTKGQPEDDPSKWPELLKADIGDVEQFD